MIPIDLDIDMLRCFKAVAQTGSFTKTGKKIGLTQSGVSIKIKRLEERLESRIFNRTSKSLSLTAEGEVLMEYARQILSAHDEAVGRLTNPTVSGLLRIGFIDYCLPELLPGILIRFRRHYPSIHLDIQINMGINLVPMFEKGHLDIVVADQDKALTNHTPLTREPLVWMMSSNAEIDPGKTIPLVLFPEPCKFRKLAIETLEKQGRKWEALYTGNSAGSIQTAVQAGMGLSVLPAGALREGLKKVPAVMGLPELPQFSIALYQDEEKKNPARDLFVSYLKTELENRVS